MCSYRERIYVWGSAEKFILIKTLSWNVSKWSLVINISPLEGHSHIPSVFQSLDHIAKKSSIADLMSTYELCSPWNVQPIFVDIFLRLEYLGYPMNFSAHSRRYFHSLRISGPAYQLSPTHSCRYFHSMKISCLYVLLSPLSLISSFYENIWASISTTRHSCRYFHSMKISGL